MVFIGYNPVGKTLRMVHDCGNVIFISGIAVYVLKDENDSIGTLYAEEFSLRKILRDHPELRASVVVSHNDFFGESVFRVRMPKPVLGGGSSSSSSTI